MYHMDVRICLIVLLALVFTAQVGNAAQGLTRANLDRKLTADEAKRKLVCEEMDKTNMRDSNKGVSFVSEDVLKITENAGKLEGVSVAKTPPRIDFAVIPIKPRFFFETPASSGGLWCIWGQGSYHKGKYYGSVGNHLFYDSRLHVVEYDPKAMSFRQSPELNTLAGLPIEYGDGKIHGTVDFYDGDNMYFMSYWTEYPEPKEKQWALGYEGGRLMSYNFTTNKFKDLGTPLKRVSWPYHRMDHKRGLMYGVGSDGELLVYDIKNNRILFGGFPPTGMLWYSRALIIDEKTGCAYTANASRLDKDIHIIKYNSNTNRFTKMNSVIPKTESKAFEGNYMRAHTPFKSKDGWFICITRAGHMFKFWPEQDKIEDLGLCWAAAPERLYTASIAMSPDDKYIYYMPGAHGQTQMLAAPIVQYNTVTNEKKAIAFLFPYLYDKYGYVTGGTYSLDLDEKGERLFIYMNGAFAKYDPTGGYVFGDPSAIVVHIPESERQ